MSIDRTNLPAEFFDITSAQLLIQPEPQYLHARTMLAAIMMELDAGNGGGLPGRTLAPSGAPYLALEDMQLELSDPFYTEAWKVNKEFLGTGGLPIGHTLRMNRPRFTDTTYTLASREVPVGTSISTTPVNVGSDQVDLTIKRYAGPLNSSGVVSPIGISRFDAKRSVHDLSQVREMHFKRDFHKWLDSAGVALFDLVDSGNIIFPVGMTANNDSVAVGDFPFTYSQLRRMNMKLDQLGIPKFANGRRMAIVTPYQQEQLVSDPEFQRLAQFAPPKNPLLVGSYFGTINNIDCFYSQTLTQTANSNSIPVHSAQMFGPGMVGVGPGEMPRVVPNVQDNYAEDPIAIWLFYCAFGVLDPRFGVAGRST
jgi:hypothetical protein